jgi:hypothetical protein
VNEADVIDMIPLTEIKTVREMDVDEESKSKDPNEFIIETSPEGYNSGRTYYLQSESSASCRAILSKFQHRTECLPGEGARTHHFCTGPAACGQGVQRQLVRPCSSSRFLPRTPPPPSPLHSLHLRMHPKPGAARGAGGRRTYLCVCWTRSTRIYTNEATYHFSAQNDSSHCKQE